MRPLRISPIKQRIFSNYNQNFYSKCWKIRPRSNVVVFQLARAILNWYQLLSRVQQQPLLIAAPQPHLIQAWIVFILYFFFWPYCRIKSCENYSRYVNFPCRLFYQMIIRNYLWAFFHDIYRCYQGHNKNIIRQLNLYSSILGCCTDCLSLYDTAMYIQDLITSLKDFSLKLLDLSYRQTGYF